MFKITICLFVCFAPFLNASEFNYPFNEFADVVISSPCNYKFYGEILEYDIYWGFINVGSAYIKIDKIVKTKEKKLAYHIISQAKSNSFIENFYPVRDLNEAWLDVDFTHSYGYYKDINEGKYTKKEWVLYDHLTKTFRGKKITKNLVQEFNGEILPAVFDVLSALYYFRICEAGKNNNLVINVNTRKNWQLNIKFHGKEKVDIEAGKFKCIILEPQVGEEGIFVPKAGKKLLVYISEREKLPVMLKAEVFIGSVTARLKKVKNLYCQ